MFVMTCIVSDTTTACLASLSVWLVARTTARPARRRRTEVRRELVIMEAGMDCYVM